MIFRQASHLFLASLPFFSIFWWEGLNFSPQWISWVETSHPRIFSWILLTCACVNPYASVLLQHKKIAEIASFKIYSPIVTITFLVVPMHPLCKVLGQTFKAKLLPPCTEPSTLPPVPTWECTVVWLASTLSLQMGVRGRYRVIRRGLLSGHQTTLRFSFQMEVR